MPWEVKIISKEERGAYEAFVASHPQGHILQTFAWGKVKQRTGWKPFCLLFLENGFPKGAVLLLKRRFPYLKKSIFYAPRGPVIAPEKKELWEFFLKTVRCLAQAEGAVLLKIDLDLPVTEEAFQLFLKEKGFRPSPQMPETKEGFGGLQPRYVMRLDLCPSQEELFRAFHPKVRYNIRLAQRKGVEVKKDCVREDISIFYQLLQETTARDNFLVRKEEYFYSLWDELVTRGYARLFLAFYQGKPVAGTLGFLLGKKAWYVYGASSSTHREVMPNHLLQWEMITWAKENNCQLYDLRGVPGKLSEDNPLYGLYRFKKGFNATYTVLIGEYDLAFSPFYAWLWQKALPFYCWWRKAGRREEV